MTDIFSGKIQQAIFNVKMICGSAGVNPSLPCLCICDNKKDSWSLAAEARISLAVRLNFLLLLNYASLIWNHWKKK